MKCQLLRVVGCEIDGEDFIWHAGIGEASFLQSSGVIFFRQPDRCAAAGMGVVVHGGGDGRGGMRPRGWGGVTGSIGSGQLTLVFLFVVGIERGRVVGFYFSQRVGFRWRDCIGSAL